MTTTEMAIATIKQNKEGSYVGWSLPEDRPDWSAEYRTLILDGKFTLEELEAFVFLRKEELAANGDTCRDEGRPHTGTPHAAHENSMTRVKRN